MAHWYTCEDDEGCGWSGSTALYEGGMICPNCSGELIYDGEDESLGYAANRVREAREKRGEGGKQ